MKADPIQLQQVILNLVVTGREVAGSAGDGSRMVVGRAGRIDNGSLEVAIADSGAGIPGEDLNQAFGPFFTTKHGGLGMGLSIARTIVEAHGGRIWAESQGRGGAVFRVTFPLAHATAG